VHVRICAPKASSEEPVMAFEPGEIVMLKSGGQSMTVVSVEGDDVTCLWTGTSGQLFREAIPAIALESVSSLLDDDDDEDEIEDEEEDEDEEEEEEEEEEEDEEETSSRPKKQTR
jgi:uncharacterized protein YodC (DUF2158 family)